MVENYFKLFFKNSPNPCSFYKVIFDKHGIAYEYQLLDINEAYENNFHVKAYDIIGKKSSEIYQLINKESYEKWKKFVQDAIMNNKSTIVDIPYNLIGKWIRIKIFLLNNNLFANIIYDVTKEYNQEKEIEGFLNTNLDIKCVFDFESYTYRLNKKFENIIGYKLDELKGKTPLSIVHEDDIHSTIAVIDKLKKEHKPIINFVNRNRCKDGSIKYFEWYCKKIGKYGYFSARDVTQKRKETTTLFVRTQYELETRIIENLNICFGRSSYPELKLIDINNKAYNYLKQINPNNNSSFIGQNLFDINNIVENNNFKKVIQNLIENNLNFYIGKCNNFISGEEKYFKYLIQPLFDIDMKIIELTFIAFDITEEITAKNKMEETLKMQEEVFANISHEIKTPLNVIFSADQLLNLQLENVSNIENKEKLSKGINAIKQNCYRLIRLVNNIIDISKVNTGYLELRLTNENIVNITENIVQSVSEYIKGKGLNIIFDTNTEEKIIACDTLKIERILLNLISNAIKFSNTNGEIFVSLIDKGDSVEIAVKDNGIGIDKNKLNEIFKRFKQVDKSLSRNAEGSGIGLSLVKSLVELHDGNISVESEIGKGSKFKIELPCKTIDESNHIEKLFDFNNKIEMINIEFSDIYSL